MKNTKNSGPDHSMDEGQVASRPESSQEGADENVTALLDSLAAVAKERDEAKDGMLRAIAELQNFRRRSQEQLEQTRRVASESLARKLLPVLDNFERTQRALEAGATVESLAAGVQGVETQLRAALESVMVQRIEAVGQPFDPELHEAIAVDTTDEVPPDTVTVELEAGYQMAGTVIRPAKVKVAKSP